VLGVGAAIVLASGCATRQTAPEQEAENRPVLLCSNGVRMVQVNNLSNRPVDVFTYHYGKGRTTTTLVGAVPPRLTHEFALEDSMLVSARAHPDTLPDYPAGRRVAQNIHQRVQLSTTIEINYSCR
jgi:hypothetical protein